MKKIISNSIKLLIITCATSCSLLNNKTVTVPVSSSPPGANLYINDQFYGTTPTVVNLVPKGTYRATLVKEGYGSTKINMETWASVRGGRCGDTFRCVMDAMGTMLVLPAIGFLSVNCRDFKMENYMVTIPNTAGSGGVSSSYMPMKEAPEQVQQYKNPPMDDYQQYTQPQNSKQNNQYNNRSQGQLKQQPY
jgi:hypothetical protein